MTNLLKHYISILRDEGIDVRGTCAHGHPTCITHQYGNIQIWSEYKKPFGSLGSISLTEVGLQYDCNMAFRHLYHSDSGNEWNGNPQIVAKEFASRDITLMINIHPQWWF
jgi:hypothetical protein